ncbi:DUF1996 domain-containing protein [Aquihabitans sp. McL0605]|uniref:DUF1996 domain-containing protein n=1 Tax=Aquihabitans sp. McL0605 TaxID=3415671 RepID=UPI003CF7A350
MSLKKRSALLGIAGIAIIMVAISVVATSGSDRGTSAASSDKLPTSEQPKKAAGTGVPGAVPSRYHGPQGNVGQFVAHCKYSHSGTNDPIVHPDMAGMSHLHDFYGSVDTNAQSTPESLHNSPTTCDKEFDSAGYWHPALYDHGKKVTPYDLSAYYRAAPGVDAKAVVPFPFGIKLLAGDQTATKPQPGEAAGWACGVRTDIYDVPPTCPTGAPLHLVLTFPDCWDGKYLDSVDHVSHATYSAHGDCPKGFPVHIPQLTLAIRFPIVGTGHDLKLASGSVYSAHGDFMDGWDPAGLKREVVGCINRGAVCDLATNRQEEGLFSYTT